VIEESERKTKAEVARKKEERIRKIKEEQMLTERKIEVFWLSRCFLSKF